LLDYELESETIKLRSYQSWLLNPMSGITYCAHKASNTQMMANSTVRLALLLIHPETYT
jgi:hypothetical protein